MVLANRCFYMGEYTARGGFAASETNQLILNLKKPMERRHLPDWHYKGRAINTAADDLKRLLGRNGIDALTFVPVPPSKAKADPAYDDRLSQILQRMGAVYDAEDFGRSLESVGQEAEQVQAAVRSGAAGGGQGFGLTAEERRAVEQHAMKHACAFLESEGYAVQDTSANRPFDFIATRDGQQIIVEVKGSTGPAESILLTANEVAAHKKHFPHNMLIIVHSINLVREVAGPKASAGVRFSLRPWQVDDEYLKPLAYQYEPINGFASLAGSKMPQRLA